MPSKKYAVVGAGWFGLRAVRAIEKACPNAEVTVLELGSKDYIDMNMQTPRVLIDPSFGEHVYQPLSAGWSKATLVNIKEVLSVTSGKVTYTDADGNEKTLEVDGVVLTTGAKHSSPLVKDCSGLSKADRIAQCQSFRDAVAASKAGVLVVGGGTTGVEVAGEIGTDLPDVKCTLINKPEMLVRGSASQKKMHGIALKQLKALGVTVINGDYVDGLTEDYVGEKKTFTTSKGTSIEADVVIMCVGAKPNIPFAPPEAIDKKSGGLVVDNAMLCSKLGSDPAKPVWAMGDCTMYGGRGWFADPQTAALAASLKNFDVKGTIEGGPAKYRHKVSEKNPAMFSIGRKGGGSSLPFPNKMVGKALKAKDLSLKFMYNKEFKMKV